MKDKAGIKGKKLRIEYSPGTLHTKKGKLRKRIWEASSNYRRSGGDCNGTRFQEIVRAGSRSWKVSYSDRSVLKKENVTGAN